MQKMKKHQGELIWSFFQSGSCKNFFNVYVLHFGSSLFKTRPFDQKSEHSVVFKYVMIGTRYVKLELLYKFGCSIIF